MRHIITGLVLALALAACGAGEANGKASLVGLWERSFTDAVGQKYRYVFEFRGDGTYTYHDGVAGHAGTYQAKDGKWSSKSSTERYVEDSGTYAFSKADTLKLTGRFGATTWTRVTDGIYLRTMNVGGQQIPWGLPDLVTRTLSDVAKPWQADAIPVTLEIDHLSSDTFEVEILFYSPSTGGGLRATYYTFQKRTSTSKSVNWGTSPIPPDFVDLPNVVGLARQLGIENPLKDGMLRRWEKGQQAWTMNFSGKGVVLDAVTGKPITGELTSYVEDYNRGWAEAVEQLKRAFPDRSQDTWDWGTGDDDNDGMPPWCRDEAYDAWRARSFVGNC